MEISEFDTTAFSANIVLRTRAVFCLPSADSLFGVLEVPSPLANPGLSNGGVWTRDDDGFRVEIGADIDGRRLANVNGRLSSESLSVEPPKRNRNANANE